MIEKIFSQLKKVDIVKIVESINPWFLIAVIFSFYYLGFVPNHNEENYLQLAKAYAEPNWIANSFLLSESPGTRFLYQVLVGFVLKFLSFEMTTLLFRIVFITLFSNILSKIYRKVKLNNLGILIHLVLLFIGTQSLYGGEFMFLSVEAKSFSYLLVLIALYHLMKENYLYTLILLIIATYFHILVGFYAFVFFSLAMVLTEGIDRKTILKTLYSGLIYLAAVLPMVIIILSSNEVTNLEPSADWIYTHYRNPHHTAIFKSFGYFFSNHLEGVLLAVVGLFFLLQIYNEEKPKSYAIRILYHFTIISLIITLFLVPLALFDKNGVLLKYYPYRINSLTTFVLGILLIRWAFNGVKYTYYKKLYLLIGTIIALNLASTARHRVLEIKNYKNKFLEETYTYIKKNTAKDAVILSLFDDYTLPRKIERDQFVSYKFVPAELGKIHEWYFRVQKKNKVKENLEYLLSLKKEYKIDYILSKEKLDESFLKPIIINEEVYLYKIL